MRFPGEGEEGEEVPPGWSAIQTGDRTGALDLEERRKSEDLRITYLLL